MNGHSLVILLQFTVSGTKKILLIFLRLTKAYLSRVLKI